MRTVSEIYSTYPEVAILHAIPKNSTRGSRDTDKLPLAEKLPNSIDRLKSKNIPTFSMTFSQDDFLQKRFGDVGIIVRNADIQACFIKDGGVTNYEDPSSWESSNNIKDVLDSKVQNELILTNGNCCGIFLNLNGIADWTQVDIWEANKDLSLPSFFICDQGFIRCHWEQQRERYRGSDRQLLKISEILV